MIEACYSPEATAAMIHHPQDRAAAVGAMIQRAGGKLIGLWFCIGKHDIVAIAEMPDNTSAMAMSMAIGASGAMRSYRSTALLTSDEAQAAMKLASAVGYQAPK
jgi:uncharacterized protein with GYD domain